MTNHCAFFVYSSYKQDVADISAFIFVLDIHNPRSMTYGRAGRIKKTWFVRLPSHIKSYPWDKGGEDGDFWGRSVKSQSLAQSPQMT